MDECYLADLSYLYRPPKLEEETKNCPTTYFYFDDQCQCTTYFYDQSTEDDTQPGQSCESQLHSQEGDTRTNFHD